MAWSSILAIMNIDFVITELDVGGAESALASLATALSHDGHSVRIFSLAPKPTRAGIVDHLRLASIDVTFGSAKSLIHFLRVDRELRHWLRMRRADVVQSFMFHANVMTATIVDPERHVAGIRVADPTRWRSWVERRALRHTAAVVCVSAAVAEFTKSTLRVQADRVSVIGNGVDASRFANASPIDWSTFGLPPDAIVTLFVGRLHEQKGLECLESQIDAIAPENSRRHLVLIGDGPLRAHWESFAAIHDQVWVLPWMADVTGAMAGCRVLVLPSRFEGMANVVLEAMAAGRPVVCSDVEGSQELVGDDSRQRFVAGDSAAMVKKLAPFWDDVGLANAIGQSNQARVMRDFSIDSAVAAYAELYAEIACQSPRQSV